MKDLHRHHKAINTQEDVDLYVRGNYKTGLYIRQTIRDGLRLL